MSSSSTADVRTAAQIRREFIDFFVQRHGHAMMPSSPVVPHDDPTLLFTNAGMNQFKDVFLGQGTRHSTRVVNSQKCIRAGGKHNDLEDVGRDTYHHTFFEMLGNWSFGDYFKAEAIEWAWTLLTDVWGLEPDRLYVTVFEGAADDGTEADTDAEALWQRHVDPSRISRWGKKDNFWEMGAAGPCGPCSEIHYDSRSDEERRAVAGAGLVNRDHPDVIEIWNLVFIQFNRVGDGRLAPLPAKHVDTGMGFERIVRVLQGKRSNYDTDVWQPIFRAITEQTAARAYGGSLSDPADVAYRVIADHVRCLTIAITDGAIPGNEGRGYVLRRILRRAVRVARQTLGQDGPLLYHLVPAVVASLGDAFPELTAEPERVAALIREEEESFLRTLDRGLELFAEAATPGPDGTARIAADDAFKLHDTFGFPIDLTRVMAAERGIEVDVDGYEALMLEARERSRRGGGDDEAGATLTLPPEAIAKVATMGIEPTRDLDKYHARPLSATVKAIWNGTDFDEVVHSGRRVAVILDRTNHYAEQGGQIGDQGFMITETRLMGSNRGVEMTTRQQRRGGCRFEIGEVQMCGPYVLHLGRVVDSELRVGDAVMVDVSNRFRDAVRANHTATHLLNFALQQVLGEDVAQKGSLVADDRLRFDFSHRSALTPEELNGAERLVNALIHMDQPVHAGTMPLETARTISGVRAVFGERYPDPVRVVAVGVSIEALREHPTLPRWAEHAIEFCGGTHLDHTGFARRFVIVQEGALAAGVRRITALTGPPAMAAVAAGLELEARAFGLRSLEGDALASAYDEIRHLAVELTLSAVARHRVEQRLEGAGQRLKALRKGAEKAARQSVIDQARVLAESVTGEVIVDELLGADKHTLRDAMDVLRSRCEDVAVLLLSGDEDEGKVAISAVVPPALIARGLKAGDWVKTVATICGGGGGGRPDSAQAGGRDTTKIPEALEAARQFAAEALG